MGPNAPACSVCARSMFKGVAARMGPSAPAYAEGVCVRDTCTHWCRARTHARMHARTHARHPTTHAGIHGLLVCSPSFPLPNSLLFSHTHTHAHTIHTTRTRTTPAAHGTTICVCLVITAVPITKLFAWGDGGMGLVRNTVLEHICVLGFRHVGAFAHIQRR